MYTPFWGKCEWRAWVLGPCGGSEAEYKGALHVYAYIYVYVHANYMYKCILQCIHIYIYICIYMIIHVWILSMFGFAWKVENVGPMSVLMRFRPTTIRWCSAISVKKGTCRHRTHQITADHLRPHRATPESPQTTQTRTQCAPRHPDTPAEQPYHTRVQAHRSFNIRTCFSDATWRCNKAIYRCIL